MSSGSNDRNFNEGMSAFKVCKTARRNGARHECRGRGPKGERALGMNYFYEQLIEFSSDRAKIARFAIFPIFSGPGFNLNPRSFDQGSTGLIRPDSTLFAGKVLSTPSPYREQRTM